jgi:hypothetical protein
MNVLTRISLIRAFRAACMVSVLSVSALVALAPMANAVHAEEIPSEGVGVVSLLLGKAYLESAGNARQAIKVGSAIHVGDEVLTESNGHVHIRFVDDALVSVRPNSRLQITDYQYSVSRPEQSTVKFNLVEGVTRSISGEAGRSARERFRLDTPIAAIGVRGTDFVVSASQRNVRALVNEGAIVVAPYSADCIAGMLGPCQVGGVELFGSSMQIIEVAQGGAEPVLRPRPEQELHELLDEELDSLEGSESDMVAAESLSDVYQESVTVREVTRRVMASRAPGSGSTGVPSEAPTLASLRERQLAWGRWSESQSQPQSITLAFADARSNRAVTVGTTEHGYGLYRSERDGNKRVDAGLGNVAFNLDAAQAFHHADGAVEAMRVTSGKLNINFEQGTFATALGLQSAGAGTVNFFADGRISNTGYFHSRGSSQNIAGAVSTDGREAGYFFDKQTGNGFVQGLTLWGASQ